MQHERTTRSITASLERRLLTFLASKMPAWVHPDLLTALGVLAALLICVSYWLTNYDAGFLWLASAGFVLNWFGDSLDGSLARYRKTERERFGFFIDHTIDTFSTFLIGLGLGLSPFVSLEAALLLVVGYLMLTVLMTITVFVEGVFSLSISLIGPTEMRLLAIGFNALVYAMQKGVVDIPPDVLSAGAMVVGLGEIAAFVILVAGKATRLARLDAIRLDVARSKKPKVRKVKARARAKHVTG